MTDLSTVQPIDDGDARQKWPQALATFNSEKAEHPFAYSNQDFQVYMMGLFIQRESRYQLSIEGAEAEAARVLAQLSAGQGGS